jgi:hypothetical protein
MTYKDIQETYRKNFNRTVKECWIADVKRQLGHEVKVAPNRYGSEIVNKCPEHIIHDLARVVNGELK